MSPRSALLRLDRARAAVLIVDVQERLSAAMTPAALERVLQRTVALIRGARALGLPLFVTEQYRKGLGPTVAVLEAELAGVPRFEKLTFSAWSAALASALGPRDQLLIAGMETHVCVYQTVRDVTEAGKLPLLCADAVLSRTEADRAVGLELCRAAGAQVVTVESALFDLLQVAGTREFKAVSAAVK